MDRLNMEVTGGILNINFPINSFGKEENETFFQQSDFDVLIEVNQYEPDWIYIFFEWMPESIKDYYFENIESTYNESLLLFLRGLQFEYGYREEINLEKALEFYFKGANINNSYCLFKLFYILKDSSNKFQLSANFDLAMFFLIKSSSYNETFLDFNKIDPIMKLMHVVCKHDRDVSKCLKVIEKAKKSVGLEEIDSRFLNSFLKLNFCQTTFEFKKALEELRKVAEEDEHPEAIYKLACINFNPIHKEIIPRNVDKSLELFDNLFKMNYTKAFCSYYKVCEDLKLFDRMQEILKITKKLKYFTRHFYANFLSKDKEVLVQNSIKIFKNFFKSFVYGNIISCVVSFEMMTQIFTKNWLNLKKEGIDLKDYIDLEKYFNIFFEFANKSLGDKKIREALDYDIYVLFYQIQAYFYYKGIIVEKNYEKCIEILESSFSDKRSVKNYRKVLYYLAKAYKKLGNVEKSAYYYQKTLEIYIMLKEFPYHHYVVGKIFLKGEGHIEKSLEKAAHFFNLGAKYTDNFFFINSLYSYKCQMYLENSEQMRDCEPLKNFDVSQFVCDESICIICYQNFRQIVFTNCGHKYVCSQCFDKMHPRGDSHNEFKCPFCKQVSSSVTNDFCLSVDNNN